MYELRILNGLHRGATLPLDGQALVVGASEDADIVLVDPGIETRHASVQLTEAGWSLSPLDGKVRDEDSNRPQDFLSLQPGAFARVGDVWLTVCDMDTAWQNPPPEPVDALASDPNANVVSEHADGDDEHDEDEYDDEDEDEELMSDGPLDEPGGMAEAGAEGDAPSAQAAPSGKRARKSGWRNIRAVYVSLAAVTVLSACAAFAMSSKNDKTTEHASLDTMGDLRTRAGASASASASASAMAMATDAKPAALTPEQLRQAFRRRLEEVGLLRRFDLDLRDRSWHMKAALDDDEAARFGRVLVEFVKQHHITFPVNAKIGSAENMLPFKIRQVISGQDAGIITSEGDRIYVGDTFRGMRLASIEGNQLHFTGKRKIDIKW